MTWATGVTDGRTDRQAGRQAGRQGATKKKREKEKKEEEKEEEKKFLHKNVQIGKIIRPLTFCILNSIIKNSFVSPALAKITANRSTTDSQDMASSRKVEISVVGDRRAVA